MFFSSIADHHEWVLTAFHGCPSVGRIHKSQMGFTWLLSSGHAIPGVSNHASMAGHPLPARAWEEAETPWQNMAFMLIAPSTDAGCEWVFSLTAMWAHPHQAHLHTLEEAAHKLLLLVDDGLDWPYTFVQMNDTVSNAPLSSEEHTGAMTDSMPSTNASGQLHQLQVWKLLQHRSWVVCTEGINGELKAQQLTLNSYCSGMLPPTWTHLGPTSNRVGPWQCRAQQYDHHSDSHYHSSATPFSGQHCWTFSWHQHGH